jgi:hypothetical protein
LKKTGFFRDDERANVHAVHRLQELVPVYFRTAGSGNEWNESYKRTFPLRIGVRLIVM